MATVAFGSERKIEGDVNGDAGEPHRPGAAPGESGGDNPPAPADPAVPSSGDPADPAAVAKAVERERKRKLKDERIARLAAARAKAKAKRDAKAGVNPAAAKATSTQTTLDLTNLLYSLHAMGAAMLKSPTLAITEEEAKLLGLAITRVSEQYDVPLLDEKTRAWLNLAMAMTQVYGTRVAAEWVERRKKAPAPPPMVLTPFKTPHPNPPQQQVPIVEAYVEHSESAAASGD